MNAVSTANRRKWMRFPSDAREVAVMHSNGTQLKGVVVDESFGGVGLLVESSIAVDVGVELKIVIDGAILPSIVRNVTRKADGSCRIGLQWPKTERKGTSTRTRNSASRSAASPEATENPAVENHTENPAARQAFLAEIPSGVFKLSTFFEAGNWGSLRKSLERLAVQSEQQGAPELAAPIAQILKGLDLRSDRNSLAQSFDLLIESCLMLVDEA